MRKRMAAVCSKVGVKAVVCSRTRDEAAACPGARDKATMYYRWQWWHDDFQGDRRAREGARTKNC
jgi:hypothetical protein